MAATPPSIAWASAAAMLASTVLVSATATHRRTAKEFVKVPLNLIVLACVAATIISTAMESALPRAIIRLAGLVGACL